MFLINTRSLAWYATNEGYSQIPEKQQVLDLLAEQVKIASNMLEMLNRMLIEDNSESICSTSKCDEFRNFKTKLSIIKNIDKTIEERK